MDDQALQDYFKFDAADLDANRNGKLSEKQQQKLVQEKTSSKKWGTWGGFIGGLFFLGIASIFPIVFIPMAVASWQQHDIGGTIGNLIGPIIWVLVWGAIGVFLVVSGFRRAFKPPESKVLLKKVAGPINIVAVEESGSHGSTYIDHELHIGKEEFDVDEDLAGLMMQGDVYAIYYTEDLDGTDQEILSVEKLPKG